MSTTASPTADHLRRTARVVFTPAQAYLCCSHDNELRICHARVALEQPWLDPLWIAMKETVLRTGARP